MHEVSVVIPTFNRADTLLRAVESALNQTYPVLEILVCDDGSTDASRELVDNINDPRVLWMDCGRNGMPSVPRNIGIHKSRGQWIAFLDSDDEWLSDKIEKQFAVLLKTNGEFVSTNAFRIKNHISEGNYLDDFAPIFKLEGLFQINRIICSSVLTSKKLLLSTSLFPESASFKAIEDYALWLRLATKTKMHFLNEPLLHYTDDSSSSVRKNYTDIWQIKTIILNDFKHWTETQSVRLPKRSERALDFEILKAKNNGRMKFFDKVREKLFIYTKLSF